MSEETELEQPCKECGGDGILISIECDEKRSECYKCNGSGFVPTKDGKKILALLRHNIRTEVQVNLLVGQ